MLLTVTGLDSAPIRFVHLWGRYVIGFRPRHHCLRCLQTKVEKSVSPSMADGTYRLRDDQPLFYLCGVGQPDRVRTPEGLKRRYTNVHLAVRHTPGRVATIGSVYGVTFTIEGAEAIPIQPLPSSFGGLADEHWRCKNFQFGYQIFAADEVGQSAPPTIINQFREPL